MPDPFECTKTLSKGLDPKQGSEVVKASKKHQIRGLSHARFICMLKDHFLGSCFKQVSSFLSDPFECTKTLSKGLDPK